MKKEYKILIARMDEVRDLLHEFGLELFGYDPGVSTFLMSNTNYSLHFNNEEWHWLEPLLKELKIFREREKDE
jgi:hypothetical protein